MKKILFLAVLLLAATQAFAGQVSLTQAQAKAMHFLQSNNANRLNGAPVSNLKLLYAETGEARMATPAYYIFNADNSFIIVAGDDRAEEILAYGEGTLDMNTIPENMKFWLSYYAKQIEYLQQNPDLKVRKPALRDGVDIEPMIEAMWDQGAPYYNQCPGASGTHAMTGCATTSLAQVFYFWKSPTTPTPVIPGYTTRNKQFTLQELPSVTFNWANMLPTYWYGQYNDANATAVAQLMRYIGQAEEMNYGVDGSDAWEDDIARACDLLGYQEAVPVYKSTINFDTDEETTYINDEDWLAEILGELQAGRPMVFCAFDYVNANHNYVGHAFNVDGYRASDGHFHINWGWSGTGNGFFAMNEFANQGANYHMGQRIVKNIYPSVAQVPTIIMDPAQLNMDTRVGRPVTKMFTVKGKLLTDDITLTLNDPDGAFAISTTTLTPEEYGYYKWIIVTYDPDAVGNHSATVTLSSPGAEDKVITLNGTADMAIADPVMLPVDPSAITLTSFRADWTDETPDANITSYTLDVELKPTYYLVGEADWSNVSEAGFSAVTANAANYFPAGWSFAGNDLWAEDGCISISGNFSFTSPTYNLVDEKKATVVFTAKSGYAASSVTVSTSVDEKVVSITDRSFTQFTVVLDCADLDKVTITNKSGNPYFLNMQIYAGQEEASKLRATESGNETHRTITGITDKSYKVTGLSAGGTFFYKVKAHYIDNTESEWSNIEQVTLSGDAHVYELGDVNHDGFVTVTDVTALINALMANAEPCPICSDINGDEAVNVTDVIMLINMIMSSTN